MGIVLIVMFLLWLGCGAWAASIASKKGRSAVGFFFLGLILGIFGPLIAALLRPDYEALARTASA